MYPAVPRTCGADRRAAPRRRDCNRARYQLRAVASRTETDVWHAVEGGRCDYARFRYREHSRHLAVAAAVTTALTLGRHPARKGEQPAGWNAPAVLNEGELLASIELDGADQPDAEPRFFRRRD